MKRIKVKIIESIAGLADPKSTATLDAEYNNVRSVNRSKDKPLGDRMMGEIIEARKKRDRYGEPMLGFTRDWSFRPSEEVLIEAELAVKWEACGYCVLIPDTKAA